MMKEMKKKIAVVLSLCMLLTVLFSGGIVVSAANYQTGDLVMSRDFEELNSGASTALQTGTTENITGLGIWARHNAWQNFSAGNGGSASLTVAQSAVEEKHLRFEATNGNYNSSAAATTIYIQAPADAKDANGVFTVDLDMKLDTGAATQYNLGLSTKKALDGGWHWNNGAYLVVKGNGTKYAANGTIDSTAGTFKQSSDGRKSPTNYALGAWNTYRFIVRKTDSGTYYADLYVNGSYFYKLDITGGSTTKPTTLEGVMVGMRFPNADMSGGVSIDNVKFYKGAVESTTTNLSGVTKGKFNIEQYDFNDLTEGTQAADGTSLILQGKNYDHSLGKLNGTTTGTYVANKNGRVGENDIYLTTENQLEIKQNRDGDSENTPSANSLRYGTWLRARGESLEYAADMRFSDAEQIWTLQLTGSNNGGNLAIELDPKYYSHGWCGSSASTEYQSHRSNIEPALPINEWLKVRIVITRGAGDVAPKLSIYVGDKAICKNQPMDYWYLAYTDEASNTPIKASDLDHSGSGSHSGFSEFKLCTDRSIDYDNIEINHYFNNAAYEPPTAEYSVSVDAAGTAIARVTGENGGQPAKLVIAEYDDDNMMINVEIYDADLRAIDAAVTQSLPTKSGSYFKAYLWDDLYNMMPFCAGASSIG